MIDPVVELSIRLCLALVFATAAWHKALGGARFAGTLRAYRLLPAWMIAPVTWLLPLAEAAVALGFVYAPAREAAVLAAVLLLGLYTFAIAANLALGRREIDCGCFASSVRVPLSGWLLVRNGVLILAACVLLVPIRARALLWVDALTVVQTLLISSVLWAAGRGLATTGPALRRFGGAR
ncbi:MAG: MauE/DoxX family redox-associated membrane protein [Polyangiales bacterium]